MKNREKMAPRSDLALQEKKPKTFFFFKNSFNFYIQ